MGKSKKKEESSSSDSDSSGSSSEHGKKEKKFDDPNEGGSIMPCVVVIVVLAIIGGAIFAIIKHLGPGDDGDGTERPTSDKPKPVLVEEDVIAINKDRTGGSWINPSQTNPTKAKQKPYKFNRYPSGACAPVGVNYRTEKSIEWIDDILEYCIPSVRPNLEYVRRGEQAIYFIKTAEDGMKGAAYGCKYHLVFTIDIDSYGQTIGNFTYDEAKGMCDVYFGGHLAMFETPFELCQIFSWMKEVTEDEFSGGNREQKQFLDHIKNVGTAWVAGEQWHRTSDGRTVFKNGIKNNLPLTGPFKFVQNQDQSKIGDSHRAGLDLKRRAFIAAPKDEKKLFLCKTCTPDLNCFRICQHQLYPDFCNNGRKVKEWWML